MGSSIDVCVLGGAGHIGLPLALLLAKSGLNTLIYDINTRVMDVIRSGKMPFLENEADFLLQEVLQSGRLHFSNDPKSMRGVPDIVITIGTPVDEFLNPSTRLISECMDSLIPHLEADQALILRSTVSPGTTEWVDQYLRARGKEPLVAFCPERVVQGNAISEIQTLPQIVSGTTPAAVERASRLFSRLAPELVVLSPMEAEFAKLFCNAYRYIQFATTNQFYMMVTSAGLDYSRILNGITKDYDRMKDFPRPGFAAGPCLFKDTMQLASFSNNQFSIGMDAMLINEGLPLYLADQLSRRHELSKMTVGLLGMAFKANSDDTRSSLSYKIKKIMKFRARAVLTADPHVETDPELVPAERLIAESDLLILCVPHREYRKLTIPEDKKVVDIWNFLGRGTMLPS